jgi:acetoin utilization deacetylase AcuC-like enzyme
VLLAHQHVWSEGRAATAEELLLCHTAEHVELVRGVEDAVWLDGDTICTETTFEAAALAAGTAIEAALRGGFALVRRPATTLSPGARWASASSTTSRWRRAPRSGGSASSGL